MKKLFKITAAAAVMAIALCGCGGTETAETETTTATPQKENNMKEYVLNECSFMAPSDMVDGDSNIGIIKLQSANYEEDGFEISGYGTGHTTYVNDPLEKTFEEWNDDPAEPGTKIEKISYDYKDGEKYEETTYIVKYEYSEGSTVYDLEKLNAELEGMDLDTDDVDEQKKVEVPEVIVKYTGHRTIVNKADKSQAIELVVDANSEECVDTMKEVLDSLKWVEK